MNKIRFDRSTFSVAAVVALVLAAGSAFVMSADPGESKEKDDPRPGVLSRLMWAQKVPVPEPEVAEDSSEPMTLAELNAEVRRLRREVRDLKRQMTELSKTEEETYSSVRQNQNANRHSVFESIPRVPRPVEPGPRGGSIDGFPEARIIPLSISSRSTGSQLITPSKERPVLKTSDNFTDETIPRAR